MTQPIKDRLYGETLTQRTAFRFHCETLYSRSSLHRFEIDLHRHEGFLQILYISGGNGDATLNGEVTAIRPPAIVIVPPGFEHGFRFSRDIAGLIITIIPAALSTPLQSVSRQYLKQPIVLCLDGNAAREEIAASCETISREYSGNRLAREPMIEGQIASLIVHLARVTEQSSGETEPDRNSSRFDLLLNLITRHIREQRQTEFYVKQLGVSQTHLNRLVRRQCGTSLQRLIAQKQLETAQQELLFTVSTVQMVSTSLGFSDPAYFSRFFLRETGMTPRAWRMSEQARLSNSLT